MADVEAAPDLSPEQLDRRRRIVDAAFELGADGGYDAVQMRDVAATANVVPRDDLPVLLVEGPPPRRGHERVDRPPAGARGAVTAEGHDGGGPAGRRAATGVPSAGAAAEAQRRARARPLRDGRRRPGERRRGHAPHPGDGRQHPRRPRRARAGRHPRDAQPRVVLEPHRVGPGRRDFDFVGTGARASHEGPGRAVRARAALRRPAAARSPARDPPSRGRAACACRACRSGPGASPTCSPPTSAA